MGSSRKRPLEECDVDDLRPLKRTKCIHGNGTHGQHVLQTAKDTIAARPKCPLPSTRLFKQDPRPSNILSTTTPTRPEPARVSSPKRKDQRSNRRKNISPSGQQFSIHEDSKEEELGLFLCHHTHTLGISDGEGKSTHRGKENIPPPDYIIIPNILRMNNSSARTPLCNIEVAQI